MKIAEDQKGATSVYTADVDGDGYLDVISAGPADSTVAWYKYNDESETWAKHVVGIVEGVYYVTAVDVTGDGKVDIVACSPIEGKVLLWKNKGEGGGGDDRFEEPQVLTADMPGAIHAYADDLDGDGDTDVLVAAMYSNRVSLFENRGEGNFSDEQIISSQAKGASYVSAADINGDGELDVVVASLTDGKVTWYENMGGAKCDWVSPGPHTACRASKGRAASPAAETIDFNACKRSCAQKKTCFGFQYEFASGSCAAWNEPIGHFKKMKDHGGTLTQCYVCARPADA